MSSARPVCAVMRPAPPPAASPTATPRASSLSRSDRDNHEIEPSESRSCDTTNASATATITSSIANPAARRRNRCVISLSRRAENAATGKKTASNASTGNVSHAARRKSRRYVNRDATSAPISAGSASSMPASHLCDASPTFAKPGSTSRSRWVTSGWSLGSRGSPNAAAESSWCPGSTRTTRTPDPVSISSTHASATLQPLSRSPSAAREVVREGGVADTREHHDPVLGAGEEARHCRREAGVRGERGRGVGSSLAQQVERVACEDHDSRAATPLDRRRDRPGDLPGDVRPTRREPQARDHERLTTAGDAERDLVGHRHRRASRLARDPPRSRVQASRLRVRPSSHRPQSSTCPRPHLRTVRNAHRRPPSRYL